METRDHHRSLWKIRVTRIYPSVLPNDPRARDRIKSHKIGDSVIIENLRAGMQFSSDQEWDTKCAPYCRIIFEFTTKRRRVSESRVRRSSRHKGSCIDMHLYHVCGSVPRVKGKKVKPFSCVALHQLYGNSRQWMTCGGLSRFELGELRWKQNALFRAIKLSTNMYTHVYTYTFLNDTWPIRCYSDVIRAMPMWGFSCFYAASNLTLKINMFIISGASKADINMRKYLERLTTE